VHSVTKLAAPPNQSAGGAPAAFQGTSNSPTSEVGSGAPAPAGAGGVVNTITNMAAPAPVAPQPYQGDPGGSGGPETLRSNYTPGSTVMSHLMQGRFAQGASFEEMRKGVDMGQELTMGPGHTMEDQRVMELKRQEQELGRHAPLTLHPHERWISDPMLPEGGAGGASSPAAAPAGGVSPTPGVTPQQVAGGPVVHEGPSGVQVAGEAQFGQEAATEFAKMADEGATAGQQREQLHDMLNVYQTVVKDGGVTLQDAGTRAAVKAVLDKYGLGNIDLTQTDQVKSILDAQLLQMMGNMRQRTGQVGSMSDRDMDILRKTIADPTRSTAVFLGVAQAMDKALDQSARAGELARSYRPEFDSNTIQNLRGQVAQTIANANAGGMVKQMFPDLGWDIASQGGGAAGGGARMPAPAVGTVEEGHRYIGGDPANPASWAPVGAQ
jgi:hypothetical protein